MPQRCKVCSRADRGAIDKALIDGRAFRNIAERFGTSATALHRHKQEHIPTALVKARSAHEVTRGGTLMDQVSQVRDKALSLLAKAESERDWRCASVLLREIRCTIELMSKVTIASGEMISREEAMDLVQAMVGMLKTAIQKFVTDTTQAENVLAYMTQEMRRKARKGRETSWS